MLRIAGSSTEGAAGPSGTHVCRSLLLVVPRLRQDFANLALSSLWSWPAVLGYTVSLLSWESGKLVRLLVFFFTHLFVLLLVPLCYEVTLKIVQKTPSTTNEAMKKYRPCRVV